MKLRNKKTGEIGEPRIQYNEIYIDTENHMTYCYKTLYGVYEEWEYVSEEPKEHWCITMYGGITRIKDDEEPIDDLIEIGNYFNSKEDAYDAWDKCKAWKRMRDKGFRFKCWYGGSKNIDWEITSLENETYIPRQICDDLDLLFGGEE